MLLNKGILWSYDHKRLGKHQVKWNEISQRSQYPGICCEFPRKKYSTRTSKKWHSVEHNIGNRAHHTACFVICKIVQLDQIISEMLQKYKNLWFHESKKLFFQHHIQKLFFSILKIKNMGYALSRKPQGSESSRIWLDAVFLTCTHYATPQLFPKSSRNYFPLKN